MGEQAEAKDKRWSDRLVLKVKRLEQDNARLRAEAGQGRRPAARGNGRDRAAAAAAAPHRISPPADTPVVEGLVRDLLLALGEDTAREGLLGTPRRLARSLSFLTGGYAEDVEGLLSGAVFEDPCDEMVVVRDIEMYSLCEHHMLPFFGKCHIGYIPRGRIVGLSKLPRIVDTFARRLQVQERLTTQIASAIEGVLRPKGVGVVIEASHLCMMMRGVEKQNSRAVTSCMLGSFKTDNRTRSEFLGFVG